MHNHNTGRWNYVMVNFTANIIYFFTDYDLVKFDAV
jgi:hypothetical protein